MTSRTIRWEIYYVHPRTGRTLSVDTLRRTAAGRGAAAKKPVRRMLLVRCSRLQQRKFALKHTYIHKEINRDRMTENDGCLGVPANTVIV